MKSSAKKYSGTRRNRKECGAISVFLIIVLVPCIVLSSICVDLSRVQLSKSVAISSADLALNTLLTNYDGDLSDWYGMIGSCQEIESLYKVSAGYFERALTSKGLSDDEFLLLSDVVSGVTDKDEIYDLLQVSPDGEVKIEEVAGANLANPTLVKDQIVEFMKYRGPIELTLGIIDSVSNDESILDAMEAEENEPLVKEKQAFYEAEGELLKAAYNSFLAVMKYYDKATSMKLTNEKLSDYAEQINGYRDDYEAIHNAAVSNLLNTGKLGYTYYRKTIDISQYYYYNLENMSHVYSRSEENEETETEIFYINNKRYEQLIQKAESAITKFDNAKSAYESNVSSVMSTMPGSNDVNEIQWWVRMHNAVYEKNGNLHQKLSSAADSMMEHIRILSAAQECMPDPKSPPPADWASQCSNLVSQISNRHSRYLSSGASSSDPYVKAANTLAQVSAANRKKVKSNLLYITINGSSVTVDNAIKNTSTGLKTIYDELVAVRNLLNVAIDGDGKDVPSLTTLASLADAYHTGLDKYQSSAENTDTALGDREEKEIQDNIKEQKIQEDLTKDSVKELNTRLTNIRSQLNTLIKAIEDMKYGETPIKDIKTFTQFRDSALKKVKTDNIPLKNAAIKNYASSTFRDLFKPSGDAVTLKNTTGNSHNPQLNLPPDDPAATATPKLLIYMNEEYDRNKEAEINNKEKEQDEAKSMGKDAAEGAKNKSRYHGDGENLTSSYSSGQSVNIVDGAFQGLLDLIEILMDVSKVSHIRDDLYVTSYIMEMFSYATFEEEGMYSLVENKTELRLPSEKDQHTPAEYQNVLGNEETRECWYSTSVEDTYNKTLTNKMINKTNNVAYAAEVEYILKGKLDNQENVKAVYQDIYGIRYALNLVSAFQNFWSGTAHTAVAINSVANTIQSISCGIIPAPVTKVVVLPILTIFETSKDLDRLEAGFPVELYKAGEDWWVGISDLKDTKDEESITGFLKSCLGDKNNPDKGISYSDYLTMFVYLGLKSSQKNQMYYRIADVIEANMARATGGSFKMQKVRMYFTLNASLRVKPMMVALPYYFDDYNNLMVTTDKWCTYSIRVVRGYS